MYIKEKEVIKVFYNYLKRFDLEKYEVTQKQNEPEITIDINKVMEQRKRYHKLYASGLMQEDELFDLIKETDQTIAEYEKQNENREVKQYDIEDIKQYKDLLLEMWDISSDEDKEDFIKMAIKNIYFEYIIGTGNTSQKRNSLKITSIEFY